MKLTFHGVGGAFCGTDQYNSGAYIEDDEGKVFLIDCGTDGRHSLAEAGVTIDKVSSIFITHLHADHVGGLEWLAFASYFNPKLGKPTLYIMEDLYEPLKAMTQPGLGSIKEIPASLGTYFDIRIISKATTIRWRDMEITPFDNMHTFHDGLRVPSYGLRLVNKKTGKRTLYSGDTVMFSALAMQYEDVDQIFHDCETLPFKSGVHAHYSDLRQLNEGVKNIMYFYHYAPVHEFDHVADGFAGFIKKGTAFSV